MEDVRYTAIGFYNGIKKILTLELGIPEDNDNNYVYKHYDLTTKLKDDIYLNVILTNINYGENQFEEVTEYHEKISIIMKPEVDAGNLNTDYRDEVIDLKKPDILFLLVHDNQLSPANIREIKGNVFEYYGRAKIKSNFISEDYPKENPIVSGRPRTLGMSIIKK
ncbi:hypothetical protein [Flavobacterium sp.]|jgi:hypothetical protein|uniref:hypothetical protein n=1 Tax=Flavobacterium sp. TaxID=239 RepID=UPI0037BE30A0